MEFDPLSRDVAPPRHEIESDSEDEGINAGGSSDRKAFVPPKVQIMIPSAKKCDELLILLGEGGEGYLQDGHWAEEGTLAINDEQQGAFTSMNSDSSLTMILLLRPSVRVLSDQACFAYLGETILSHLKPKSVIMVDDYNAALYITTEESSTPQIRVISSDSNYRLDRGTALYESPNYVLGLAAAIMNEASVTRLPSTLYLIPQNTNAHLQSFSRLHPDSTSLDVKPEPLMEESMVQLSSLLPLKAPKLGKEEGKGSITSFLDKRRTNSRHKTAASLSGMYV